MALLDSDLFLDDLEREFDGRGRRTRPLVSPATAVIAAAAVGSAILHFAYASAHFDEYWAYGAFFVAVAWFQLAAAAGILLRPSRGVLVAAGLLNAGVARRCGSLRGRSASPSARTRPPTCRSRYPDALATAFEVTVVVGVLACLLAPGLLRARFSGALTVGIVSVLVVAMAAATAYAMTPRFTSSTHTTVRVVSTPAPKANPTGTRGDRDRRRAGPQPDQLSEQLPYIQPTPAEQATLAQQLVDARAVDIALPDLRLRDRRAGSSPPAGSPRAPARTDPHSRARGDLNADGSVDASNPGSFIYDWHEPDLAGDRRDVHVVRYGSAPAGFAGLNDHWHRHAQRLHPVPRRADPGAVPGRPRRHRRAMCDAVQRNLHEADGVDGARVGRARLGEPARRLLARQPRHPLRRRHHPHRQGRVLPGNLTAGAQRGVTRTGNRFTDDADVVHRATARPDRLGGDLDVRRSGRRARASSPAPLSWPGSRRGSSAGRRRRTTRAGSGPGGCRSGTGPRRRARRGCPTGTR